LGLNRERVGRRYPVTHHRVERDALIEFARATQEDNPALVGENALLASPMYAAVWWLPAVLEVLFDKDLLADANIGQMVHHSQDMLFSEPVAPGDELQTRAEIVRIEDFGNGEMLTTRFETVNQSNRSVLKATSGFLFRGPPDPGKVGKKPEPTRIPRVSYQRELRVADDQTFRYAQASGDHNPIHLDEETAKGLGFPGIIVHGMCVMSLAQKAVLDDALQGDPLRMRRLAVEFAKPVYPGDRLTWIGWQSNREGIMKEIGFVLKSQRGEEVIRKGIAEWV
jgi:acyl dehydratase